LQPTAEKLTAKQERALVALLSTGGIKEAAELCAVNESTIWRWLQLPSFQTRYRAARRQVVETAIAQLQQDCSIAVRVLREVAEDAESPASSRVAAAKTILDQSVSAIELMDLQERIEKLEAIEAARYPETKGRLRA
jgi:hypothetical protein